MPKFLIEVPHEEEVAACTRAVKLFQETGSHWVTKAEWGCLDGDHRAWMIVDLENKDEAARLLPPLYRSKATIVQLTQFTKEFIDKAMARHGG